MKRFGRVARVTFRLTVDRKRVESRSLSTTLQTRAAASDLQRDTTIRRVEACLNPTLGATGKSNPQAENRLTTDSAGALTSK